jgi:hypothetical protein
MSNALPADTTGMAQWNQPTRQQLLVRVALAAVIALVAPATAAAQSEANLWGYAFASPVMFYDSVAITTSFEPGSLTPRTFDVRRTKEAALHWGFGFEWQVHKAVGIAAEAGAVHLSTESVLPGPLLAVNASYHFGDTLRRTVPFATGGYSFGINSNHGFDVGAGVNYWIGPKMGLRFEIRGTALRAVSLLSIPGRFEPYAWALAGRAAVNFGRKKIGIT